MKLAQLHSKMQQLHVHVLLEKAESMHSSLPVSVFLQFLPSNVRMILEYKAKRGYMIRIGWMADSVMEVNLPSIITVATPQATEFGETKGEMANLKRQLSALQATGYHRINSKNRSNRRN